VTQSSAQQRERMVRLVGVRMQQAIQSGLARSFVEHQSDDGATITIDGRELVNMGSCAYLGLNVDKRLKEGAVAAVERYGPVYSSSTAYTSIDLYRTLHRDLQAIFGGHVLIPTTTTLGHLSVLPVVVSPDDLVLMDHQVHASVQLAAQVLRGLGAEVVDLPHNDVDSLARVLDERAAHHPRVWYLADGIYSMFGDTAPVRAIMELVDRHDNMWVYFDDAHGVGWKGTHGVGHVFSETPHHDRMIVIGSLAKSWGAGGSVVVLPDREMADLILMAGATFTFSGPIHPAELGAAVAAAEIHLSPERDRRQSDLEERIDLVRARLVEANLPALSLERTPLWFVRVGSLDNAIELGRRLLDEGFYVNLSGFPIVPWGMDGIRFTNTVYQSIEDLDRFMDALARHLPDLVVPMDTEIDLR
jgi:7-keto-8-aminopelargonate synthetase-like enzyme